MSTISPTASSSTRGYFPYIDGLRALSIVAVVLVHLDAGLLPAGFGGVDIFFVISGFVVSASLHSLRFDRFRDFALFFYARRLRRIMPALVVVLVAAGLATTLFVPVAYLSLHIEYTGKAAFFGLSNVVLAQTANDYFAPRAEYNPFTHTWSLGVEEQFYLVFPLLYYALTKSQRSWKAGVACLATLMVGSVAYCFAEADATARFYMIFGRFWELGTGVCLYLSLENGRAQAARSRNGDEIQLLPYLGAAMIGAGFFLTSAADYPLPGGLLPVGGTALLILGLHGRRPRSWIGHLLVARPMVAIGLLSYSLYLWHWPVFALFRWTTGFDTLGQKLAAVAIAVVLAIGSYRLIERPFRSARLLRAPKIAIAGVLSLATVGFVASVLVYANGNLVSRSVVNHHRNDWYPAVAVPAQHAGRCEIEVSRTTSAGVSVEVITPKSCPYRNQGFTLFVIGDSHADALAPMLRAYALATTTKVVAYSSLGCAPIDFVGAASGCKSVTESVLAEVRKAARPGDLVLLSSLTVPRLRDQWEVGHTDIAEDVAPVGDGCPARNRRAGTRDPVGHGERRPQGGVRAARTDLCHAAFPLQRLVQPDEPHLSRRTGDEPRPAGSVSLAGRANRPTDQEPAQGLLPLGPVQRAVPGLSLHHDARWQAALFRRGSPLGLRQSPSSALLHCDDR